MQSILWRHKEIALAEWISVKEAADYTGYTTGHNCNLLNKGLIAM